MARKLGLLAITAAVMAYAPMAAWGCSGSSAQLSGGPQVAQGYGSQSAQPMQTPDASQTPDQSGSMSNGSGSSSDKSDQ